MRAQTTTNRKRMFNQEKLIEASRAICDHCHRAGAPMPSASTNGEDYLISCYRELNNDEKAAILHCAAALYLGSLDDAGTGRNPAGFRVLSGGKNKGR